MSDTEQPASGNEGRRRTDKGRRTADLRRTLTRKASLARSALMWERLWPRLALPLGIIGLFLGLSWVRAFEQLPDGVRLAAVVLLGIAFLASLYPLFRLRRPSDFDAARRLERDSDLRHQPLTALADRQAGGRDDPVAQALWEAHRRRAAAALTALKVSPPSPRLDRRDPYVLRAAVFLLLVIGLVAANGDLVGPVRDALKIPSAPPPNVRLDAWVTPPAYTRRAPVFLTNLAPDAPPLTIPEGSVLSIRVTGVDDPAASFEPTGSAEAGGEGSTGAEALERLDTPVARAGGDAVTRPASFEATIDRSGTVTISDGEDPLRRFDLAVTLDLAPTVRLVEDPAATARGAFRLAYEVKDDFRVSGARAVFADPDAKAEIADGEPAPRPLVGPPEMALVLPRRGASEPLAETFRDLSAHPWAGGVSAMRLEALDDAGNVGATEPIDVVIPARPFSAPLAKMLVEQRRTLALDANQARDVVDAIDSVMLFAPDFVDDASIHLGLRVLRNRIIEARDDDALRETLDLMWEMALAIDGGDASLAEQKLREAREALREALREGAPPEEIARLMEELREALDEYMQALAEQMRDNPDLGRELSRQEMQNLQEITPQDLQKMLDRMEELSRLGDNEAAEQLLSQLDQMLENMQMARPGQQGEQGEMDQMMNELAEMIMRQQELMNETFQMSPDGGQRGQNGEQQPMTPEQMEEAMRRLQEGQGELQQRLEEMMRQLQEGGMEPGEQLGEAGRSMGEAEQSLGQGQAGQALGNQGRALDQLRQGAQQLAEQMQNGQGEGEGQGRGQRGRTASQEDPLGRPQRRDGPDFGDSVKVPGEIDVQRARRILEELRRRFSDDTRPMIELDYLRRLLTPF